MKSSFKDNFSVQAADYAKFRPTYPDSLFEYLVSLSVKCERAWDCGTGNGQCAVSLAKYFASVIATDPSEKQLANAAPNSRIEYRLGSAEASGLTSDSVDLVTVAQALHWFRLDEFWQEVRRVLHPDGIIGVWCYELMNTTPDIDAIIDRFYRQIVGPYWEFERTLVEKGYRTIEFPFHELETPPFEMSTSWSLRHLKGYLQSWSATQKYIMVNDSNPIALIEADLNAAWGDPELMRLIKWPLSVRVGRNTSSGR